jgi:predicted HicB family RNase H-like nuclease
LAFRGDGETIQEAINNLSEIKEYLFSQYIEKGIPIPEPPTNEDKSYSGRFVLRIPAELHQSLSTEAQKNNTTLNQYCIYLLTRKSCLKTIQDEVSDLCNELRKKIEETDYSFENEGPSNIISFDEQKYASGV